MKRKIIEIWLEKVDGEETENVEFRNVIKDTPENKKWFDSASDILKQFAYVLYKIHEKDVEEMEVNEIDREGETSK